MGRCRVGVERWDSPQSVARSQAADTPSGLSQPCAWIPSDVVIKHQIVSLMRRHPLATLSTKKIRELLTDLFKVDLSDKKALIEKTGKEVLHRPASAVPKEERYPANHPNRSGPAATPSVSRGPLGGPSAALRSPPVPPASRGATLAAREDRCCILLVAAIRDGILLCRLRAGGGLDGLCEVQIRALLQWTVPGLKLVRAQIGLRHQSRGQENVAEVVGRSRECLE
uniref:DEK-C domain-containing protein n=1 Tax=Chromera velia CCMP2878 TaxID=1169474 RepID=A0A0G4IBB5_9ALVE|mmetsp:Transcript_44001/g.86855  ORF Transcript_44001/g.86855 Transcript_44001/m.86855 type:complete len:226 (+) Transcript_44001:347-1024(+)|eukprot:Cvel_2188.t1-p1 / transcript=Cvel_2188.t1 / gene=Cvel_2188 / organism=Chromera_velia_CCMP2878 / gene_product=Ankyrin repeat and MYND domain-containing protein 2, putative / transcript_product=Ankyrin repeat and MYND domain-containing protein 2, putative / location=Cvel_scaffold84:145657-146691(-) / protein_length=225 / sequence_SO=supercontig / SO=protein_coding / is_pseudo=false